MESLGKNLTLSGDESAHAACPMVWGEPGTNSQHAYFQWLHQANKEVAVELLLVANADHAFAEHQMILLANGIAQADALAYGKCAPRTDSNDVMVKFRDLPGGKPVSVWALRCLDAYNLGFMLACYEHKMLCLGALWNINPFDQFGVELGKSMAADVESYLQTDTPEDIPAHLSYLLNWLQCQNT
jgi:glucose-6-phosphate isomerase